MDGSSASSRLPKPSESRRSAGYFLLLAAGAAVGAAVLLRSMEPRQTTTVVLVYGFMLTPAAAAVVTRLGRGEGFTDAGLCAGRAIWYFRAWLIPLLMVAGVYGLLVLAGEARFDLSMDRLAALVPGDAARPATPPPGLTDGQFLVLAAIANATIAIVPASIFGFGEELGWRGHLLPRLLHLGPLPAILVIGIVWWAWHLPLAAVQPGLMSPGAAAIVGIVAATSFGGVLAWIRYASGSIFPVALAHAAYNNINSAGVLLFDADPSAAAWSTAGVALLAFAAVVMLGGLSALKAA